MNRWEMEQKIVMKALKDPAFKKQLISNPKETVLEFLKNEKITNISSAPKVNIRVVEEKKGEWVLSIPYLAKDAESLSEAEMEKFAAGDFADDFNDAMSDATGIC